MTPAEIPALVQELALSVYPASSPAPASVIASTTTVALGAGSQLGWLYGALVTCITDELERQLSAVEIEGDSSLITATGSSTTRSLADWMAIVEQLSQGITPAPIGSKIDCLGDSITEGQGIVNPYPIVLAADLPSYVITNSGVSGNTTTQIRARWEGGLSAQNFNRVPLLGGVNDLATDVDLLTIEGNLDFIWSDVMAKGGQPIAMTIAPWKNSILWTAGRQTNTDVLNAWILARAVQLGIPSIDVFTALGGGADPDLLLAPFAQVDNIHPSQLGAQVLERLVYEKINGTPKAKFTDSFAVDQLGVSYTMTAGSHFVVAGGVLSDSFFEQDRFVAPLSVSAKAVDIGVDAGATSRLSIATGVIVRANGVNLLTASFLVVMILDLNDAAGPRLRIVQVVGGTGGGGIVTVLAEPPIALVAPNRIRVICDADNNWWAFYNGALVANGVTGVVAIGRAGVYYGKVINDGSSASYDNLVVQGLD